MKEQSLLPCKFNDDGNHAAASWFILLHGGQGELNRELSCDECIGELLIGFAIEPRLMSIDGEMAIGLLRDRR